MSVDMADVSALGTQSAVSSGVLRGSTADGERIREKAREAQEQVRLAYLNIGVSHTR